MWKKSETGGGTPPQSSADESKSGPETSKVSRELATIGPSISMCGDLSGDEDLMVQGRVEGTITLRQNTLTVGREGRVKANVHAKLVRVEGNVEGDLRGDEQVIVNRSGNVQGNIVAPRVTLEDGCKFRGTIDMDVKPASAVKDRAKVSDFKAVASGGTDKSKASLGDKPIIGNRPGARET
ncbi:MAG: polymer-forming cytoskeletal protein [Gammaproteobacteria bacterium]|nr:MAG: polymer-forming cytoskeletal protein [Gammaproteobacteria bacterium]